MSSHSVPRQEFQFFGVHIFMIVFLGFYGWTWVIRLSHPNGVKAYAALSGHTKNASTYGQFELRLKAELINATRKILG